MNHMHTRMKLAGEVARILLESGVQRNAVEHIWDRLVDGLSEDTNQELATLYTLLLPDESTTIYIKEGNISSPKESGAVAYRKV